MVIQLINLEEKNLKVLYYEICNGYSKIFHKEDIYIKHFGDFDFGEFENNFFYYFEKAKSSGLPSYEEKLKVLEDQGYWTKFQEEELKYKKEKLKKLESVHKNLYLKAQVEKSRKDIDKLKKDVENLDRDKKDFMGMYAETYAQNKLEYIYILNSFYKDPELKNKKFNIEEDDIESALYYEYILIHNKAIEKFDLKQIKNLAIADFFQNIISISEQNAYYFYNKPVHRLTYYQMSMFNYGKFFSNLLSNEEAKKLDEKTKKNPDKLIDWYTALVNFKTKNPKSSGKGISFVMGATEEDLDYLGQEKRVDLNTLAQSKGGTLTIEDLSKISKV